MNLQSATHNGNKMPMQANGLRMKSIPTRRGITH